MSNANTEAAVMSGGPGQENKPVVPTPGAQPVQPKQISLGTKVFNSQDELINYTKSLETKVIDSQLSKPLPVIATINKPKPSELLFSDPDAFYEMAVQDATQRIDNKISAQKNEVRLFDQFYSDNPELKEHKDLVQMAISHRREEYKDLPAEEGLSKIALEIKSKISSIKGVPTGGKELSSAPAIVAGSGNSNTTTQVAARAAPMTMVEAMLRQKQKKGKS